MSLKVGQSVFTVLGLALVGFLGYQAGKSKGQVQREALQAEILRMQAVAQKRNAEVQRLRVHIASVDAEIRALGMQRESFEQFVDWLAEQHPALIERYRHVQQAEDRIASLEEQGATEHAVAQERYAELWHQFPEEVAKLSERERRFLS